MASTLTASRTYSRSHARACIALLVVLGFALGCSEFVVIGIEEQITHAMNVPLARAGELISYFAVTYAVATPLLALFTGRFRRFHLLVAYLVLLCMGNLISLLAPTFEILLVGRIFIGLVSGAVLAIGVTYLPELVPADQISRVISVIYAAFSIAMVISTSVGKMIAEIFDWHTTMFVMFALVAVAAIALALVLPKTSPSDEPCTAREQFRLLKNPRSIAGVSVFVFGVGSVYVFYAYITPYLENILGMDPLTASGTLMCFGIMCMVSNLASGWLDSRFGMKALLVVFVVQAGLLLALYAAGSLTTLAFVLLLAIGLSMYCVSVPCISMFMRTAREEYPKALTLAASLEPMAFNIGIAFGTAIGGSVVANVGMSYVGAFGAIFSLVAFLLVAATLRLVRAKEQGHAPKHHRRKHHVWA